MVSPQDIDAAASEIIARDANFDPFWWDKARFEPKKDGVILGTILDKQNTEWTGISLPVINEAGKRVGLAQDAIAIRIRNLRQFHIIVNRTECGLYKIKALNS